MNKQMDRRQFLKLAGLGGVVFVSGLAAWRTGGQHVTTYVRDEIGPANG